MEKIGQWGVRDVGTDPMMVRHRGLVLLFIDRTGDSPFIPNDPNGIGSVLIYIYLTQLPSKLVMLKHLFVEF